MGWFGRALWTAVQDLKADLQILEVKLATDYVRYDRLERMMEPFKDSLKRIEDVLVHKVDKP